MLLALVRTLAIQRNPLVLPDEIAGDGCILLMPLNEGIGNPKDYSGYNNNGAPKIKHGEKYA